MTAVELDSAYVSWLHYTPLCLPVAMPFYFFVLFLCIIEEGIGRLGGKSQMQCIFQEVLFAKTSWIKWLFSIEQHMFLLAGEKKAEARLEELSWFRQRDLDCTHPVCAIVACGFPVVLLNRFLHIDWGSLLAWNQGEYSSFSVHNGCVAAVGSLSTLTINLPGVDGLQQLPELKTGPSKKTEDMISQRILLNRKKPKSLKADLLEMDTITAVSPAG